MTMMRINPERLRDEARRPGQKWVHPETRFEYEDFDAYICGEDPLHHWRNNEVARITRTWTSPIERKARIEGVYRNYSRHGFPFSALGPAASSPYTDALDDPRYAATGC